ncbi:Lrp/AsnC family transcriptional regulator [Roseovarius sp. ZX-A-9]|uniref:Lrp/AsnC family transcriptional regulator n=1 Tax=Roseovarius sp. ZX-A-9 TaxID=3014783 RepID=UPI002FEE3B42
MEYSQLFGNFIVDNTNRRILSILQYDSQISMARLSERVGLSLSACHRRVKNLEAEGLIEGYGARLSREALGLEIQVFIEVRLTSQRQEDIQAFETAIARMPEILECHLVSGELDYLMRVTARNTAAYADLYRNRISQIPSVLQIKTLLSLATVKEFRGYHLD